MGEQQDPELLHRLKLDRGTDRFRRDRERIRCRPPRPAEGPAEQTWGREQKDREPRSRHIQPCVLKRTLPPLRNDHQVVGPRAAGRKVDDRADGQGVVHAYEFVALEPAAQLDLVSGCRGRERQLIHVVLAAGEKRPLHESRLGKQSMRRLAYQVHHDPRRAWFLTRGVGCPARCRQFVADPRSLRWARLS